MTPQWYEERIRQLGKQLDSVIADNRRYSVGEMPLLAELAQWCKPDEHSSPEHWDVHRRVQAKLTPASGEVKCICRPSGFGKGEWCPKCKLYDNH